MLFLRPFVRHYNFKGVYNMRFFIWVFIPFLDYFGSSVVFSSVTRKLPFIFLRVSARATPHSVCQRKCWCQKKGSSLQASMYFKCVHRRHKLYVILMQRHGKQHPHPRSTQHAAFVCTLCEVALRRQLDVSCVTAKCEMRLQWELVMVCVWRFRR